MGEPLLCDNFYPAFMVGFEDLQLAVLDSSIRDRYHYTFGRCESSSCMSCHCLIARLGS